MKKIFLLGLGAFAMLALGATPSQADGIRLSVGPGYYDQGAYPDGYYHRRPHFEDREYRREYRRDDGSYYIYRNGHRHRRVHRWHDDDGR